MRKEINALVRSYAKNNENCFEETWNRIYREFNRRNHVYIKARARHRKVRPLDVIEQMGMLTMLFVIATEIL